MTQFKPQDDDSALIAAEYGREVLFEVILMGNAAKVTAVDAETGLEVSIIGPANATSYTLKQNAMRKLINALSKGGAEDHGAGSPPRPKKPGIYA
jgi:hypothetical protein